MDEVETIGVGVGDAIVIVDCGWLSTPVLDPPGEAGEPYEV